MMRGRRRQRQGLRSERVAREAQRYLARAVGTLKGTRRPVSVAMMTDAMVPERLEYFARTSPSEEEPKRVHDYVDSLSTEQRRGLAASRGPVAILAESEVSFFLCSDKPTRQAARSSCSSGISRRHRGGDPGIEPGVAVQETAALRAEGADSIGDRVSWGSDVSSSPPGRSILRSPPGSSGKADRVIRTKGPRRRGTTAIPPSVP